MTRFIRTVFYDTYRDSATTRGIVCRVPGGVLSSTLYALIAVKGLMISVVGNVMVVRLLLWRSVKASLIYCIPKQVCKFALAIVIKVRGFNWLFRLIKRRKFFISSFFLKRSRSSTCVMILLEKEISYLNGFWNFIIFLLLLALLLHIFIAMFRKNWNVDHCQ